MPFIPEKGYVPLTIAEITENYRNVVNSVFGTNYTETQFVGTGFWRAYQSAIERDREIENTIPLILQEVVNAIKKISDDIFYSESGLVSGITMVLKDLEQIKDVNIYNPVDLDLFRGLIGIALEYSRELDDNDLQLVANTILNNIGAGIHTYKNPSQNIQRPAIVEGSGQVGLVNWREMDLIPVWLKFTYFKKDGFLKPSDEYIKEKIIKNLEEYKIGTLFVPQYYSDSCVFPEFRKSVLEYSFQELGDYTGLEIQPDFFEKYLFSKDRIFIQNGE